MILRRDGGDQRTFRRSGHRRRNGARMKLWLVGQGRGTIGCGNVLTLDGPESSSTRKE